jgi:hypothetical protein
MEGMAPKSQKQESAAGFMLCFLGIFLCHDILLEGTIKKTNPPNPRIGTLGASELIAHGHRVVKRIVYVGCGGLNVLTLSWAPLCRQYIWKLLRPTKKREYHEQF